MPVSRSVPMWGLASQRISSGAPWAAMISRTWPQSGLEMPVVSLPSENVPAPPSPNCTLLSGASAPPVQKRSTSCRRRSTSCPRSSTMGRSPARARYSAANSPAGPRPTTTGRRAGGARRGTTRGAWASARAALRFFARRRISSSFPSTATCTAQT